jgi:DNA topoisomerase-3
MELVIAEKPSVAKSIANVIGATQQKEGYIEGNGYIVTWCVGHLVELAPPESYDEKLKKWCYDSLPIIPDTWRYGVKNDTKAQYNIVKKLLNDKNVSTIVEGTDVA